MAVTMSFLVLAVITAGGIYVAILVLDILSIWVATT